MPCRLVRAHPDAKRMGNPKWTEGAEAPTMFADAFPLLVIGSGSLDDLNQKLLAHGRAALGMDRFRPNLVLGELPAFEEEFAATYRIGQVTLKPTKPCVRCPMPSVDQATGEFGPDPIDILSTYRANPKVDGRITFGMNAMLHEGAGQLIRVGQQVEVELAF
jgi:uncharacterized protein YcbX